MKEERDEQLWQQAKARAGFKTHLSLYLVIMAILWAIWAFIGGTDTHPWPIYPTVGWGIGIVANYLSVYKFVNTAEREYRKLKGQ
ncbi:MAG: 2TM domain-containing protein [Bacteroidota bacterium]|nr:2TM domain-containing protein [Bacteroidota bacterium]